MKTIINQSRVAIVGLGQLGASLGLRLRELGAMSVLGVSRTDESIQRAVRLGAIECGSTTPSDILPHMDMVFICTPLTASIDFISDNFDHFRFGGIVTDVGSVKGSVVDAVRKPLFERGTYFIGSHPMAGTEKSGMEHADINLYHNKICFMTTHEDDDPEALDILRLYWSEIGCRVIELDPKRHDLACAHTSHMLHMISAGIVNGVLNAGDMEANKIACAGGFHDVSRIAASDVGMWVEVCKHNRDAMLQAIDSYESEFVRIRQALESEDWDTMATFLTTAKESREQWHADYANQRIFVTPETEDE